MAQLQRTLTGDFDTILADINRSVLSGSASATLEESCDWNTDSGRCAVRIYERYSWTGSNRVSMSVTLFQSANVIHLFAATSGGSQAVFWKYNTLGEEAFLSTLAKCLEK